MNQPRVLVAGGTGLLGHGLLTTAPTGWEVQATYHERLPPLEWRAQFSQMDVCDEAQVREVILGCAPTVVIHTASIGSVDLAERDPEAVRRINIGGLQAVARACEKVAALLVFISSNAVFDGANPPYAEDAPRRAVNRYGALKIEAEDWLEASGVPHLTFRPILLYGWPLPGGRSNVVTRWVADLEAGHNVEVAEDVYSMPLSASSCADAIWTALRLNRRGTYHVAGGDRTSLVGFARATARAFDLDERLIVPVPSAHFTTLAPRPHDTCFITTKMAQDLGVRPLGIREGLSAMVRTRAAIR